MADRLILRDNRPVKLQHVNLSQGWQSNDLITCGLKRTYTTAINETKVFPKLHLVIYENFYETKSL